MHSSFPTLTWITSLLAACCTTQSIAVVDPKYLHLLPDGFLGIFPDGFIGNSTSTFVGSTRVNDPTTRDELQAAAQAPFISYDPEFEAIFGDSPEITLVEDREGEYFAFEGSVWIPSRNEVWFTSSLYQPPTSISILNLETNTIFKPPIPEHNFQRGVYSLYDGLVYFTSWRDNDTYRGGLYTIDPSSYETKLIFNSFQGLSFNTLNDLTWVRSPRNDSRYLYFSDTYFLPLAYPGSAPPQQLNIGLYRWDPQLSQIKPLISLTSVPGVNAVKVAPDMRSLFVGDNGDSRAPVTPATQVIYKYDLDGDMIPVNPRVFAAPRYFLDGLQVDDRGRVWSIEGDGIVVRNGDGRILGVVNKLYFGRSVNWGMVGFAGDKLIVYAVDRLWVVKLAQEIVSVDSTHLFS